MPRKRPEGLLHDDVARLQVAALLRQRGQVVVGLEQVAAQTSRRLEERPGLRIFILEFWRITDSFSFGRHAHMTSALGEGKGGPQKVSK